MQSIGRRGSPDVASSCRPIGEFTKPRHNSSLLTHTHPPTSADLAGYCSLPNRRHERRLVSGTGQFEDHHGVPHPVPSPVPEPRTLPLPRSDALRSRIRSRTPEDVLYRHCPTTRRQRVAPSPRRAALCCPESLDGGCKESLILQRIYDMIQRNGSSKAEMNPAAVRRTNRPQ